LGFVKLLTVMIAYLMIINTVLKLLYNVLFTMQGLQYKGDICSAGVADFKTDVGIGL
jgi:hypothetical protein